MGAMGAGLCHLSRPLAPVIAHGEARGLQSAFGGDSLWAGGWQGLASSPSEVSPSSSL